ncbi:MAG TPA: hypothetical protein VJC15_03875 [Candidatus Paceibacterota bacterium]
MTLDILTLIVAGAALGLSMLSVYETYKSHNLQFRPYVSMKFLEPKKDGENHLLILGYIENTGSVPANDVVVKNSWTLNGRQGNPDPDQTPSAILMPSQKSNFEFSVQSNELTNEGEDFNTNLRVNTKVSYKGTPPGTEYETKVIAEYDADNSRFVARDGSRAT